MHTCFFRPDAAISHVLGYAFDIVYPCFAIVFQKRDVFVPGHCFDLLYPECKQGYANVLPANERDLTGFWLPSSNFTDVH